MTSLPETLPRTPEDRRELFDLDPAVVWLNAAARTPLLRTAYEAGVRGLSWKLRPWTRDAAAEQAWVEEIRSLFAGLIGGDADGVAIQPAASYGLATAAANLDLPRGSTVLVLEGQFPSNVHIWRDRAAEDGLSLVTVPRPADGDWTAAVLERFSDEVSLAALPPCHWTDGGRLDLAAIGRRCRETGAAFVVDATQAVGAAEIDVGEWGCDFLVSAAYKWLLGPYSLSFLWAAPGRRDGTPLESSMYNHVAAAGIEGPLDYPEELTAGGRRYDMGQLYNHIHLPVALAGLKAVTAWTPQAIAAVLRPLTAEIAARAREAGLTVPPDRHRVDHFVGLRDPAGFAPGLLKRLESEGIYVSLRDGALRVSPHVYNANDDVDRMFSGLTHS